MGQQNLLVDWLNKNNTNRSNMLSSIQTSMANKTTATNPTTVQTPNTPITPTPVSRPQTNLDFKKAQTSTPVVQNTPLQSSITTNNPAYQFGQLKASPTNEVANTAGSRFIGFQTPQVAQNTSIGTGQEAKSFNKLMNEEYMLINSNATNAEGLNKKEEERYRTLSEAIIDFEANVLKNNGRMSEWEMKTKFPEFADNIDSLKDLQNEIRPIIQEGYGVEPDQIAQYYPELLNPKKTYNIEATKKKSAENQKAYENVKKTMDKALTLNVEGLSSNGLKIARDFDTIFSIVDLVKNKYSVGDANDSEIFEYLIKNNEKVRGLYDEIKSLEPSLTETDKSILNRKDANLLNKVITEGTTKIIDLGGKGLENLGLKGNTKATDDEIETAIRAKEKLEEGFKDQTWKKLAVEINVPLDSLEKFAYRTYKDMYNKILKEGSEYTKEKITKTIKSAFKKELGVDLTDEQVESIENLYETAVTPSINQEIQANQQNVMDYLESVNKEYQNKKGTLDEDIENYTNNMSMTKALLNRDWRGFGYKSTGEAAQNAEMPLMVLAGTVAPEIVLPLMSMDSYARESQESFEELMEVQEKMGIPKEQAYENAQEGSAIVGVTSALVEVGLEKVLGGVETTASTAFHDLIMKDVAEKTTKMVAERGLVDLLKKGMVTQFRSSFEEGMEEIVQQWIHNKAIQKYDPDHKLTEGLLESFEGGFFNWMNLLSGGGDILKSIKQNKDTLTQNANQTAYNLGEKTRNIVDRFRDDGGTPPPAGPAAQRQNVLQNVNNKVTTQENQTNNVNQTTAITPVNNNIQNQNEEAIELKDDDTATQKKNTAIKEGGITEKVMEQLNGLDENTRERIKKNPYSIEESKNLIQEMDENPGIDFGDYQNSRYEEVLNEILDKLEQKEDKRKNDIGKLYDKLEEANVEVDVSGLKNKISEFQARAEALEDIMTPAEQAQVKTILKNIQEIGNGTMDVWKARRIADKRTKGSANSTYDGIGLIRDIRDSIDEIIREQNPDMKEVDKSYHQILKEIGDLRGNIVYKKGGQVKSNAVSTVKNMLNASNRLYLNKLEQYLPGIKDKLEAIRDSKFVYNAYTTGKGSRFISGIARGIISNIGKAIGFFAGGWGGLLAGAVVDAGTDKAMINLTRTALRDTITKETEKSKAELERINQKIEEGKKLDAEDKARLKELGEKIMQNAEQIAKERGKQAEWDKFVQDLEANETPQTTDEEQEKNKVTKKRATKKNKVTEKKAESKKETKKTQSDNQQGTQQQAVDPDDIRTYGNDYVIGKMSNQQTIQDKSGKKVKSVGLNGIDWSDIDTEKLTRPPEGVDFMDYQIDKGGKHIIVDKDGNVYNVLNGPLNSDFDSFFEGIVKEGQEGLDADIMEWLKGYNQYMKSQGWTFKDTYDKYVDNKNKILNGEAKEGWKKGNQDFIDFIESKNKPQQAQPKNNTENTGTKTSKNKITNTKQAKVDIFEEIDPQTLKILIDNGDKAAIALYEDMSAEDQALVDMYADMEYETLGDNETAQIPTIFEEDLEQNNLRELENNETPQTDNEEMEKSAPKTYDEIGKGFESYDKFDGVNGYYGKIGDYYIRFNNTSPSTYEVVVNPKAYEIFEGVPLWTVQDEESGQTFKFNNEQALSGFIDNAKKNGVDAAIEEYNKSKPKNLVTKKESKPKNLVTNKVVENNNTENSEFEVLPEDVSIEKESKEAGPKRIAPNRIPRQQLTYEDGVKKLQEQVKTVAEYIKASDDLRAAAYGEYKGEKSHDELRDNYKELSKQAALILWKDWQFKSDKSKEFKDLWKNIRDNLNNEKGLDEIGKTFYISKVKKDISRGYVFPQEVLKDIPGAKKAIDSRERYQKGLDTSFSSKDNRIDYSEKDKIGAGIKSQDGKQVTKEQKENIVKGVMDFQKVFSIDMKKIAEELGFVYVDLHGGNVFLSEEAGVYRREYNKDGTVKNSSVSVGGSETVRFKDKKTGEWKSEKVNTTMSHELGHVVDRLVEGNLIRGYTLSDLRRTFQHRSSPNSIFQYGPNSSFVRNYLSKDTEIVARAFEQYMDMAKGGNNYIRSDGEGKLGYWSKSDFENIVKPTLEKAIKEKLGDWYINPDDVKYQKNVVSNGKNKITAKTQQVVQQANKVTEKEISDLSNQLKKTGLAKDVVVIDSEKDLFNIINGTTDQARLQSVWHGSKANFNRFDSNHIGEGEGAQSHGWGHYVGVDKGLIKKYYTDVLGSDYNYNGLDYRAEGERGKLGVRDRDMMIDRFVREMNNGEKFNDIKKYYIKENEFKIKDAEWGLKEMERKGLNELEGYSKDELKTIKKLAKDEIELVNSLKKEDFAKGHLYEVEIPDTVKKDTPTGSNYWDENNVITDKQFGKIADVLKEKYPSQFNNPNGWYDDYLFAQFLNFRQGGFSEEMNGRQIYNMLSEILGGDKEASKFLESLGYDGIHYDGQRDGEAYVIFNDNNLEITEHIKYLKDAKGDIAGAVTPDGTVYLIKNNLRGDTLTHEFSHLLRSYAKQNNSDLFNAINKIAEEAPQELKDYVKATYGDLSADAFLDEVFAWRQGQYSGIKSAQTWYQRMWNAIKELWNKVKGKFGKEYADLDVFKAYEKKNSEELMKNVDQLLKGGKEIGQANGSDTRYQLAEGAYEGLDADYYEGRLQKQKEDLRKYADESGIKYKKKDGGYTIDDTLSELKEINGQKEGTAKEKEIKRIKRKEIIELMDIIDEGYGGEWQYKRYFDDNPDYSMTPTTIFFWKGDNMDNAISFHQPKRGKGYEFVPKGFLPIAPK